MVSLQHEILIDLFKNRPSLAAELLKEVLHIPLPHFTQAQVRSIELNEIQPAEYRADLVILLLDHGRPVRVLIVEVQLAKDENKRFTWAIYVVNARHRYRCPAALLVIAPDGAVADWCVQLS